MNKAYLVALTEAQRASLRHRITNHRSPARDLMHIRILLKADSGLHGPGWTDTAIATALEISTSTVGRVRKRFANEGLEPAALGSYEVVGYARVEADERSWLDIRLRRLAHTWRAAPGRHLK